MANEYLGTGWKFPVELDDDELVYSKEEQKVRESLLVILGTARGERVMRPDFGSRLHELVFAPISSSTKSLAASYVNEALVTWEPRVEVLQVNVTAEDATSGTLLIDIEYRVRATNSRFNLVYPFYLKEGSNVGAEA